MNADEVRDRIALLRPNIERITEMANARYRDIRRRSEAVFREELLEYFQKQKSEPDFFDRAVPHILKRMREFWAFKAVYLVAYSHTSKDICIIGMSSTTKGEKHFGLPGEKLMTSVNVFSQTHPIRYLYRRSVPQDGLDPFVTDLLGVFDKLSQKEEFSIDTDDVMDPNHLFIIVPFYDDLYAFIFSVRDEKGLCRLERPARGDVSELCQEFMLRVCTEVVYEFGDVKSFVEIREQALKVQHVIQVAAVAAQLVHTLGNRVGTIPLVVKHIKRLFLERGFSDRRVLERFVDLEVDANAVMEASEQLRLMDYTKQVMPLDISAVVKEALYSAQLANTYPELTVSVSIPEGLAPIRGIKASLLDTLVNLLQNAGRANAKHVCIEASDYSNSVELVISDDGDGISESDLETIWLPNLLGRSPIKTGGFHIGLWASKLVIESMMHGSISVESKVGKGTQFTIRLLKDADATG